MRERHPRDRPAVADQGRAGEHDARRVARGHGGGGGRQADHGRRRCLPVDAPAARPPGGVMAGQGRPVRAGDGRRGIAWRRRPLARDGRRGLLRPAEVGDEVVQTGPAGRVLIQAGAEDVAQRPGQRRQVGRLAEDPADDRGKLVRVERPVPGRGEHQHPAEGEEVAAAGDFLAAELLGCHVAVGADERVDRRQRAGIGGPGDAEVDDARPVGAEDDVAGLEVPVDEPAGVNGGEPLGQGRAELAHLGLVQRAVLADRLRQRRPGDVGGDHPRRVGVRIGVHHRGRVEAPHLPGGRDLAREPAAELGVVGVFGADELDRYLPAAGGRAEEHLRHAARAEPAEQPVTADKLGIARLEGIHRSHAPQQRRIRRWTDITSLHSRFSVFSSGVGGRRAARRRRRRRRPLPRGRLRKRGPA